MSSPGPDNFTCHYDFVAASKAVLETLVRYAAQRIEGVNLNIVRGGYILTESFRATFGKEFEAFAERFGLTPHFMEPKEAAQAIVLLCSGLLDGVNGQVLTVDRGASFFDTLARIETECGPFKTPTHS